MWTPVSPLSDTKIETVDIGYTNKYLSASTQGWPLSQTRLFVRCSLVCESGAEVELVRKCCKVSWFITVTHWGICTVMFVLFSDSVNNKAVLTVHKSHQQRKVRNETNFGYYLCYTVVSVTGPFGQMKDIIFWIANINLLVGAEHLSSRYASSDEEMSRIFEKTNSIKSIHVKPSQSAFITKCEPYSI